MRDRIEFTTDAQHVEIETTSTGRLIVDGHVVAFGYHGVMRADFDEARERRMVVERARAANPSAAIYVEGGKWTPHRGPRDFSNQHRRASKRVARNRARTKAAHRARMAQKGRK